ncbi:MAG: long-chain fatty acid--CoA ligase [Verrucomicrobia bacterium]|nr:long-chain fatty acid--CoA ligase [Verrucomicrobiota bacterium]
MKTTSASTGPGRCILFSSEQLAADADQIVATMGLRLDWPNLAVISLAHSYGFSNLVLPLLLHGVPLFVLNSSLPEAVRQAVTRVGPCTLPAVPALWRAWLEAKAISPNVKLAISAGAPLPLALEEAVFRYHGLKLHNFYGASECGGIAYDTTPTPRTDPACIGAPMHSVTLRVGDDGCLEVRSRAVGQTYWPMPEPSLAGGCFHTTDLADLEAGRVYLRGRATEQINVAGRKVSPEWIEAKLAQHPAVRECLVFGVPSGDAGRGEAIVACVAANAGATREQLRQFLLDRLASWQIPREWTFVDALPTNERGKLSRAEWRNRFLAERHPRGS